MAVDPKQVIQKNVPLVVAYVGAVVPLVLWGVLVVGGVEGGKTNSYKSVSSLLKSKKNALENIAKDIKKDPSTVYTPEHTAKFKARNAELDEQYKKMIDLIGSRSKELDKWFPELGEIQKDKLPGAIEFQNKLNAALENLKRTYKDIIEDPSGTHTQYIAFDTVAEGSQRKIQKQYWILERVLVALKKGGTVTAAEPVPVRLLANVDFTGTSTPPSGQGDKKPFVVPIPVKVTAQMSFRDVSKVARELLAQDIVFRMKGLHVELQPFTFAKTQQQAGTTDGIIVNPDPKSQYEQTVYVATFTDATKRPTDDELWFPEPKVRVTFELEALDFDMDAITAASGSPNAAQPPK